MRSLVCECALLAVAVAVVASQHHHHGGGSDPFAGSGCNCTTFCDNTCAINATGMANMTLYRMTPNGMLDMHNKNTGDPHGDTSFVLSRRTTELTCRQDPTSFMCSGVTQFDGDDSNNTDLVGQYVIEVDGNWGPYLYCNPVDTKKPLGPWDCSVSLSHSSGGGGPTPPPTPPPSPPPPQCAASNFSVYEGECWSGYGARTVPVTTLGDCCTAAAAAKSTHWNFVNGSCEVYQWAYSTKRCPGGALGYHSEGPPTCNCTRVHQTVGKENLNHMSYGGSSMHPAGGFWYSHPEPGQCEGDQRIGDGSGCTWRVVQTEAVIKAKCMYGLLDANVEASQTACFQACPQPKNQTSTCYLQCYTKAVDGMTPDQLAAPWAEAFATKCPHVPAVELPANWNDRRN